MDPKELKETSLQASHTNKRAIKKHHTNSEGIAGQNIRKAQEPSKKQGPNGRKASKDSREKKK
jgi:hypothetical protein